MDVRALLAVVLAALAAERLVELAINRRHVARLRAQGARFHGADGFGAILAVQLAIYAALPAEVLFAPWAGVGWWTWPMLAIALLAQALRYWVIRTLGDRWCIRVVTLPGAAPIASGPYRFLRHPNYLAVAAELVAIPLAFGGIASALGLSLANALALARRIRIEDRALREAAGEPLNREAIR